MLKIEGLAAEETQKIKDAIRGKLTELGAYVDNELPNYIMVMVANKKSKAQMTEDLELFLLDSTQEFTTWLHELLQNIHNTAATGPAVQVKEEPLTEDVLTLKEEEDDVLLEELQQQPQPDAPPPAADRTPEQNGVSNISSASHNSNVPHKKVQIKRNTTRLRPSFLQPHGQEDEEEEKTSPPLSSVVKIQRKSRPLRPPGPQPNSTLLVRALQEVTALPNSRSSRGPVHTRLGPRRVPSSNIDTENWAPDPWRARGENAEERNRLAKLFAEAAAPTEELEEDADNLKRKATSPPDDGPLEPRSPEPRFVVTLDGVDPDKLLASPRRKRSRITLGSPVEETLPEIRAGMEEEESRGPSPPPVADTSMEEELPTQLAAAQLKERCKFWPSCKFGDKCIYHHPTSVCKNFPMCKFGDKCLFLHPTCKFDSKCSKPDCPFTHTSNKAASLPAATGQPAPTPVVCKFFPSCSNLNCPFLHPKPCKYGIGCNAKALCSFYHPPLPSFDQCRWVKSDMPKEEPVLPEETAA